MIHKSKMKIEFEKHIRLCLNMMFGREYNPKSLKFRFENKTAFITMNSQRDAEEFIKRMNDFLKDGNKSISLYFNLYKSKVERHSSQLNFRKFNNFQQQDVPINNKFNQNSNVNQNVMNQNKPKYQSYNQFSGMNQQPQQTSDFPSSALITNNTTGPKRYNNFEQTSNTGKFPPTYNNFGGTINTNMNVQNQQMKQQQQPFNLKPKFEENDEDAIGEYIYSVVDKLYPNESSKITGMLMELDPKTRGKLVSGKAEELASIIHTAYKQLVQNITK